jgi:hypothetical protein
VCDLQAELGSSAVIYKVSNLMPCQRGVYLIWQFLRNSQTLTRLHEANITILRQAEDFSCHLNCDCDLAELKSTPYSGYPVFLLASAHVLFPCKVQGCSI